MSEEIEEIEEIDEEDEELHRWLDRAEGWSRHHSGGEDGRDE